MSPLLEELEAVRVKYGLSYDQIAREVGCSPRTAYNWLAYKATEPRPIWFKPIRAGIRKIEKKYAPPPSLEVEINRLYSALKDKLTRAELAGIFEIISTGRREAYLARLRELAGRHKVSIETEADDE